MGLTKASYALINGAYFNVLDFGAKADNLTDDQPAIQAAIDAAKAAGGGTVFLPAGTYKVDSTLTLEHIQYDDINVYLQGSGQEVTVLNFLNATTSTDAIEVTGWSQYFGMSGFTVANARRVGININPVSRGSELYVSSFYLRDIIVKDSVSDGFKFTQTYLGECDNLIALNTGGCGFNLQGFHTSMSFRSCYANQPDNPQVDGSPAGWFINGCIYSSFINCASDSNGGPGYFVSNCAGVAFYNCGAESNNEEGFSIRTSTADTSNIPSIAVGIHGVTFKGCIGVNNGIEDPSAYSNMFNCLTSYAIEATFTIEDCVDVNTHSNVNSLVLNSVSGAISCESINCYLTASTYKAGQVAYYNRSKSGYVATGTRATNVSIPNNTETQMPITSFSTNEIYATLDTGKIIIPPGINRIRVTAGVAWDTTGGGGERAIAIYYDNAAFYGHGSQETTGIGYISQTTTTALIDVAEGGSIELRAVQSSGAALNILGNNFSTFVQIEVVG